MVTNQSSSSVSTPTFLTLGFQIFAGIQARAFLGFFTCFRSPVKICTFFVPRSLSRLDRRFQDLEIRRAFTVFQLMTILEEARHSLIVIEHDPMLYEDAEGMVEYVSQATMPFTSGIFSQLHYS